MRSMWCRARWPHSPRLRPNPSTHTKAVPAHMEIYPACLK
jgi:hypothetical protein